VGPVSVDSRSAISLTATDVNNRLRVLRAELGLSQGQLAERLGVSRQTINVVENGKYDPSLPLALKIGKLFGVPVEEIFFPDE